MLNRVILHYHSTDGNYNDKSVWYWQENKDGQDANFIAEDDFGCVAKLTYDSHVFLPFVFLLVKSNDWTGQSFDFRIKRNSGVPETQIWLVEGDETIYYSKQAAMTSSFYKEQDSKAFDMALKSADFDKKWGFSGWLGFRHTKTSTIFRVWAPTASNLTLFLYDGCKNDSPVLETFVMSRGRHHSPEDHSQNTIGIWEVTIDRLLSGLAYGYQLEFPHLEKRLSRDPYAIALTPDGKRSVLYRKEELEIAKSSYFIPENCTWRLADSTEAIIYEMHVRDFSISETSGVVKDYRGKFLGLSQTDTKNPFGDSTCFDYLKDLGITHVQLQPAFDHHKTYDHDGKVLYNWGYDPENYNAPETSFSSNSNDPKQAILDFKEAINAYHDAGIGVIMDVVYNHTYSTETSAFQLTVPDYYYRMNSDGSFKDGSGCGNETASEKEMFRKYMIDSLVYWVEEYGIDGFRFDLMGLHDVETMNAIRQVLDQIDPRIILYGEGWDMGDSLQPEQKAKKSNAYLMPNIGFFNDDQRNAVKGAEVYGHFKRGFVSGEDKTFELMSAILGSQSFNNYLAPNQVVNYIEAHDNYNLNDLLWVLNPEDNIEQHTKRIELATALNLLMPGLSFMQLGQEFLRTKLVPTGIDGEVLEKDRIFAMNSYNAPDSVNQVDWKLRTYHRNTIDFVKSIINFRKSDHLFSFPSFKDVRSVIKVESGYNSNDFHCFSITKNKTYKIIFTIFSNRLQDKETNDIIISNDRSLQDDMIEALSLLIIDITS